MVKRIAFINGKGGCGKTTSIFHVCGVLSKRGDRVLVIDLDKQRNTTSVLLLNTEVPEMSILDFMYGNVLAEEVVAHALFQSRGNAKPKYYGIDVMGSDVRLQNEAELAGIDGEDVGYRLDRYIEEQGYDWVLVDMPPSNLTLNNICFKHFVDYVVVPFSSDIFSVDGYGDIMDVLDKAREGNPTLNIIGVYLARYMKQCGLDRYIREQLLGFDTFLDVQIPLASDIREAVMFGRPISYYRPLSSSTVAYESLVGEIEDRMNKR